MTLSKTREHIRPTLYRLCRLAEVVAIAALIVVTGLVVLQIVAREAFLIGLPWADELARYAGLCVIFLAVPILLAHDEHIRVDMFLRMFPPGARRLVAVGNELLMVAFCGLFLIAGWQFMQRAARFSTPAIGMPNLVFYMPAIVGMVLLLVVAVDRALAALTMRAGEGADAP